MVTDADGVVGFQGFASWFCFVGFLLSASVCPSVLGCFPSLITTSSIMSGLSCNHGTSGVLGQEPVHLSVGSWWVGAGVWRTLQVAQHPYEGVIVLTRGQHNWMINC